MKLLPEISSASGDHLRSYIWRLRRSDTTSLDHYRAGRALNYYINHGDLNALQAYRKLARIQAFELHLQWYSQGENTMDSDTRPMWFSNYIEPIPLPVSSLFLPDGSMIQ